MAKFGINVTPGSHSSDGLTNDNFTFVSDAAPLPVSDTAVATGGYSFLHIAAGAAATFVVKASAGTLHSIILNGPATATNVTTIYDNATGVGTVIGIPLVTAVVSPLTMLYDLAFANGLTIITTVANGGSMTVVFK